MASKREETRLAELMGALSFATDLGTGQPMGHALRTCYLATELARELGVDAEDLFDTYYLSLLRFLGCTAEASADAAFNRGDEIALYSGLAPSFMGGTSETLFWMLRHLAEGHSPATRARAVAGALADTKGAEGTIRAHCEAGAMLAERIGLRGSLLHALSTAFERWDGKGLPDGVEGEAIPVSCRISIVARDLDLLSRLQEPEGASEILRARRGKAYWPQAVDAALSHGPRLTAELEEGSLWEAVMEAEPGPPRTVPEHQLDEVLGAFAMFVDLKSPFLHGHSPGVAELAEAAAVLVDAADPLVVRRAGLIHDLGRVAVPSGIWDKDSPLSDDEWERVRLHPYYTERILVRCGPLNHLGEPAGSHHERLDGSGYHRGLKAAGQDTEGRLLAAADAFHAMTEARPYRPSLSEKAVVAELDLMSEKGQLDAPCVQAILEVAGQRPSGRKTSWPSGLTDREVDVLRLLAGGLSNKEMARRLTVSPKTVGHHVEHIYAKLGVTTRAGATVVAIEQGLVIT